MNGLIKLGIIGAVIMLYFYINKNKENKENKVEVWGKIKKEEMITNGNQNKITFEDGTTKVIDNPKSFIPSSIDWNELSNEILANEKKEKANAGFKF
jgi:hypothetical protein